MYYMNKTGLWVELDSGRVYTAREKNRILEQTYDFDEFTPMAEQYEYFCRLEEIDSFDIDLH